MAIDPTDDVVPVDIADPERWKDKIPVFRVAPEDAIRTKSIIVLPPFHPLAAVKDVMVPRFLIASESRFLYASAKALLLAATPSAAAPALDV